MTHSGSTITFKINPKKGIIQFKQKESYTKPDNDKFHEEFSGEYDLGRELEEILDYVVGVARSWAKGDSIRDEAKENFDDLDED